jgi:hypothetical protein
MVQKSQKKARKDRDREGRKPYIKRVKNYAEIIREEPPKGKAKIIAREELIKDPATGKAKLQTVYEVKKEKNPHIRPNVLYIPKVPPEKDRTYLRKENPVHHKGVKYPNAEKYGDLNTIKKNRLIEIAKAEYDLNDKGVKNFNKEEVIKYLQDRSRGKIKTAKQYLPNKVRLARVEPIRKQPIVYKVDPLDPYSKKSQIMYGAIKASGDAAKRESAADAFNRMLDANPKWKNVPKIGETRPFNAALHNKVIAGNADPDEILGEIMVHLDLPEEQKMNLIYLEPSQLNKIYKKLYKASKKPESEKFKQIVRLPEFEMTNVPKYAKAPIFKDPIGKPHVVGTKPFPKAVNPLYGYDYNKVYN